MNSVSSRVWYPTPTNTAIEISPISGNQINLFGLGRNLISKWNMLGYEPNACALVLDSIIKQYNYPKDFFKPEEILKGGVWVTEKLLFTVPELDTPYRLNIYLKNASGKNDHFFVDAPLEYIIEFIQNGSESNIFESLSAKANFNKHIYQPTFKTPKWPRVKQKGLYRREHASVLIKSDLASVVLDPQRLALSWTSDEGKYWEDEEQLNINSILITHPHNDHWSFPTIVDLFRDTKNSSVIHPVCPVRSILSPVDMKFELEKAGIKSEGTKWWHKKMIGDIEIVALPFYGEQPSSTLKSIHPDLRMWGNCYRINMGDYSMLYLVDSGADYEGSVIDAIKRSVEEDGEIDIVSSCINGFPEVINQGLPHYIFTQPFSAIKETFERKEKRIMTLGVAGAAEACKAAKAKYYLPYANGFSSDRMGYEKRDLATLSSLLKAENIKTEIVDWGYGDFYPLS